MAQVFAAGFILHKNVNILFISWLGHPIVIKYCQNFGFFIRRHVVVAKAVE